jgi:hypothetical protein
MGQRANPMPPTMRAVVLDGFGDPDYCTWPSYLCRCQAKARC